MREVEAMDESRRRMLWTSMLGFGVWQGLDLVSEVLKLGGGQAGLRHVATQVLAFLADLLYPLPAKIVVQATSLGGVTVGMGAFLLARALGAPVETLFHIED